MNKIEYIIYLHDKDIDRFKELIHESNYDICETPMIFYDYTLKASIWRQMIRTKLSNPDLLMLQLTMVDMIIGQILANDNE